MTLESRCFNSMPQGWREEHKAAFKREEKQAVKDLRFFIEAIMEEHTDTRNSDTLLLHLILLTYFPEYVHVDRFNRSFVYLADEYALPNVEQVKRIRAQIQNDEHKLLPTDPAVAEARGWKIEAWRELLGYDLDTHVPVQRF